MQCVVVCTTPHLHYTTLHSTNCATFTSQLFCFTLQYTTTPHYAPHHITPHYTPHYDPQPPHTLWWRYRCGGDSLWQRYCLFLPYTILLQHHSPPPHCTPSHCTAITIPYCCTTLLHHYADIAQQPANAPP